MLFLPPPVFLVPSNDASQITRANFEQESKSFEHLECLVCSKDFTSSLEPTIEVRCQSIYGKHKYHVDCIAAYEKLETKRIDRCIYCKINHILISVKNRSTRYETKIYNRNDSPAIIALKLNELRNPEIEEISSVSSELGDVLVNRLLTPAEIREKISLMHPKFREYFLAFPSHGLRVKAVVSEYNEKQKNRRFCLKLSITIAVITCVAIGLIIAGLKR